MAIPFSKLMKALGKKVPNIKSNKKDPYLNYALRKARKELDCRLIDIEEITGIPAVTLAAYESLRLVPDGEKALKIAEALGKKPEDIFPENIKQIAKEVNRERRQVIDSPKYQDYRLRNALQESGCTLYYLKLLTDIPLSTLEALENSEIALERDHYLAVKIARALGKKPNDLLPRRLKITRAARMRLERLLDDRSEKITSKEISLEELSPDSLLYSQNFEEKCDAKDFADYLLSSIDERAQRILRLRYSGYKLNEIGKMYDLSRERVRQIIDETLLKIREKIRISGIVYN